MKRKRLECWATRGPDGGCYLSWHRDECEAYKGSDEQCSVVRLVEYDPRKEAVVRAVGQWVKKGQGATGDLECAMFDAYKRLKAKRRP